MKNEGLISIYLSYILYNLSIGIYSGFLPIHLYSLGASLFIVSLLSAVPALITVFATPFWGMISHKIQFRKMFIILGLVAKIFCFIIFILTNIPLNYIISLGFFTIFICALEPNLQSLVTQTSSKAGRASGLLLTSRSIGSSLGAIMGGILFENSSIRINFILGILFSILSIGILVKVKEKHILNREDSKLFEVASYKTIIKDKNLIPIYISNFLYFFGNVIFGTFVSIYLSEIGGSKTLIGLSNSFISIITLISSTPIGILVDKIGRKPILTFGFFCCALFNSFLYFTNDPLITAVIWGIPFHQYITISSMSLISDNTSEKNRAAGLGLLIITPSIGRVVGPILGGLLVDSLTMKGLIPVSALILTLGGLCVLLTIKEKPKIF